MFSLVLLVFSTISAIDVKDIVSPRPNGWVVDQTGQIHADTIKQINQIGDQVHQQLEGAEIAVVVVQTIQGRNPRQFATELFNHWGIGSKGRDNGVLVFVALGDRKAEIILGNGVDDARQITTSQSIMDTEIIPRFKQGDFAGGLLAGTQQCASQILNVTIANIAAPAQPLTNNFYPPSSSIENFREPESNTWKWVTGIGGVSTAGIGGYGIRRFLRYRKRNCPKCQLPMLLLPEKQDDKYLQKPQIIEERIGSVDYDVWFCQSCSEAIPLRYAALWTSFSKCPECQARTRKKVETTIIASSTSSTGLAEVNESCLNCTYRKTYTRVIPCESDSDTFSSSSSSSGFSGGSSSGSGASGSW